MVRISIVNKHRWIKSVSCLSLKQTRVCFCRDRFGFTKQVLDNVRIVDKQQILVCNPYQIPAAQLSLRGAASPHEHIGVWAVETLKSGVFVLGDKPCWWCCT